MVSKKSTALKNIQKHAMPMNDNNTIIRTSMGFAFFNLRISFLKKSDDPINGEDQNYRCNNQRNHFFPFDLKSLKHIPVKHERSLFLFTRPVSFDHFIERFSYPLCFFREETKDQGTVVKQNN
jgi:hypothetical protein